MDDEFVDTGGGAQPGASVERSSGGEDPGDDPGGAKDGAAANNRDRKRKYTVGELLELRDNMGLNEAIDWIVRDFSQDRDMDELDDDIFRELLRHKKAMKSAAERWIDKRKKRKLRSKPELLDSSFAKTTDHPLFGSQATSTGDTGSEYVPSGDSQDFGSWGELGVDEPPFTSTQGTAGGEVVVAKPGAKRGPKPKGIPNVGARQRAKLIAELGIMEQVGLWAAKLDCKNSTQLLGLLLHSLNYSAKGGCRMIAEVGMRIFEGHPPVVQQRLTPLECLWIKENCEIGDSKYLELRLFLLPRGMYLQPNNEVLVAAKELRPELMDFPGDKGVYADLKECLVLTLQQALSVVEQDPVANQGLTDSIQFEFTFGMDGSGDHAEFARMAKEGQYSEKCVFLVSFCLRYAWNSAGKLIYEPEKACSYKVVRPVMLIQDLEGDELVQEVLDLLEPMVREIEDEDGFDIQLKSGRGVHCTCYKAKMSAIDGKIITMVCNARGVYCIMCGYTEDQAHDPDTIRNGFTITKRMNDLFEIAHGLTDEEGGRCRKDKDDYPYRQGQIGQPQTHLDANLAWPVCHMKMLFVDFIFQNLMPRENSIRKWKTIHNKVQYEKGPDGDMAKLEAAKEKFRKIACEMNVPLGKGQKDTQARGNWFHFLALEENREKLVSLIQDEGNREGFRDFFIRVAVLIKVANSPKRKINVGLYKQVAIDAYLVFVETFPWAKMCPWLHRALAHGWEIIEMNDGCVPTEEGPEALHAKIRDIRLHRARMVSRKKNCVDTFNHLFQLTDPSLAALDKRKRRQYKPKIVIPREMDAFVETMFADSDSTFNAE